MQRTSGALCGQLPGKGGDTPLQELHFGQCSWELCSRLSAHWRIRNYLELIGLKKQNKKHPVNYVTMFLWHSFLLLFFFNSTLNHYNDIITSFWEQHAHWLTWGEFSPLVLLLIFKPVFLSLLAPLLQPSFLQDCCVLIHNTKWTYT